MRARPAPARTLRTLALLLGLAAALCGCRGAVEPTAFYTLESRSPAALAPGPGPAVGVGPLEIPRVIDRPQLVIRDSGQSVHLEEFHRWAGPLDEAVLGALVGEIAALLDSQRVVGHPWEGFIDPDYRVPVTVARLDGAPGGEVVLEATWGVLPRGAERAEVVRRTTLREPVAGADHAALVAAHGRALGALAREMAEAILALRARGR
jgi:uncharacterized lipoprotein YmbA